MCRFDLVYDKNRMDTVFFDTENEEELSDDDVLEMLNDLNITVKKLRCRLKQRDKKISELGVILHDNKKKF